MSLINYTLKRLLATIPILFSVLFITFILVRLMEGSPFSGEAGSKITKELLEAKEAEYGLDKPPLMQFWLFLQAIFIRNDWGVSLSTSPGQPVWALMWEKVPRTLEMNLVTTFVSSFIGIKMGVFSAVNHNNWKDTLMRFFSFLFYSMPVFWLAIIMKTFLTPTFFPTQGYVTLAYAGILKDNFTITGFGLIDSLITGQLWIFGDIVEHLFLPCFVMILGSMAGLTRYVRSSMLETLELDYVRSARAKGCKERDVVNKHALRNSLIPTVTLIGMSFGFMIVGSTLIEFTFNIYGMGQLYLDAITNRDYFLIQSMVILITGTVMIANLITDILYGVLDPRIRL